MNRRELLARSGAVVASASLGGCLSRYREAVGGVGETTDGETTTTTGQPTAGAQQVALASTSFEMVDSGCGGKTSEATVSFDRQASAVSVTGTIPGSNACYVAKLADASYDPETGTLAVTVASMEKEGADICAQCIVEIDYEARFGFDGGLPETVTVVHEAMGDSKTVVRAHPN